ncbi:MAG TPA: hypothetical protein PKD55_00055 [Bellilinea sp.]|nr:hypothetical protein [Bellilinea sp.]
MFTSYEEVSAYLKGGRNPNDRPYPHGRSTRVQARENGIAVRYHNTDVVLYTERGITLNSGGWYTSTTKARINDALNALPGFIRVYQEKGVWYLHAQQRNPEYVDPFETGVYQPVEGYNPYWITRYEIPFLDGTTVDYDGNLIDYPGDPESAVAQAEKLASGIRKYVTAVRQSILDGTMQAPSEADCWYCYMQTESGEPLGDSIGDTSHLLNHIEEGYVVPSLVWRAVQEYGSVLIAHALNEIVETGESCWFHGERGRYEVALRTGQSVARYLKIRLKVPR